MTEEELYDRIPSEASQHIPFDIADVNLSYQLLEAMDAQMDVLLVAVKKDKILNHTNVLAQAGKTPVVVDIDAFGLQNCFEVNYEPDAGQTVALLNIGASVMNINIVRGGVPLFTRDVSVGGNQYTDALQKELDLSFDDAERLKKGDTLPSVTDEQKGQILRSVSDILTLEIQKTFDFFRATASGENIQRIMVAGGTARVPGLVDLLREEFAMPVEELNPFRKVLINPGKHSEDQIRELAPRLVVAVGSGAEELRLAMIRINLLGQIRPRAARTAGGYGCSACPLLFIGAGLLLGVPVPVLLLPLLADAVERRKQPDQATAERRRRNWNRSSCRWRPSRSRSKSCNSESARSSNCRETAPADKNFWTRSPIRFRARRIFG